MSIAVASESKVRRAISSTPWPVIALGDVVESMKNGIYRPAASYSDDGLACLRMYNIDEGRIVWRDIKRMRLTESEIREYELLPGDLLVNRVNSRELVGKTAVVPAGLERCVFESKNIRVRVRRDVVEPRFVGFALLASGRSHFDHNAQQVVGMASISQPQVASFKLPLPPLDVQRRIVAEIEKQFTRLAAGVAALRRTQAHLKRYRAAVLKAACEGRLVPTEAELARQKPCFPGSIPIRSANDTESAERPKSRRNVRDVEVGGSNPTESAALRGSTPYGCVTPDFESGAMLLERILTERREKWSGRGKFKEPMQPVGTLTELPEGWVWATVAQVGETTTGFTPPKGDGNLFSGDIPFFKPTDLDAGYYVTAFRDSLTEEGAKYGRVLPPGSILVTCIGATIGKTGFARVECATNQQINALTVSSDMLSPEYIFWVFKSPLGQQQIKENASATTLPILNKSKFESLLVPLAPLAEQKRIVAEVERRLSVIDELEAIVTTNLARAVRLRQSILKNAFMPERTS